MAADYKSHKDHNPLHRKTEPTGPGAETVLNRKPKDFFAEKIVLTTVNY